MSVSYPAAGSYLGHYRLVEKLDEGGMGAVFKAHEAALDRFVAVKVLSPQLAQDADFVNRFLREARAVAALNHPNIIQIYFIGQHDDYIYFAMEFVDGYPFDLLVKHRKPTEKDWLGLMRQAALGLQYAHNHGLIHRDIKPSNLMRNELGMVKVADFGLARNTAPGSESAMTAADTLGTPEYMSPEESAGDPVDHRSDIYSLGATLYHLLAGKPPFTGSSGTEILMHQMHTPLPSIRKINSAVSAGAAHFIEKCMAKKPEERYQSYDSVIKAIDNVLHGSSAKHPAVKVTTSAAVPHAHTAPAPKGGGGPGALTWLVVLAILGAAGFFVFKIAQSQKETDKVLPLAPVATQTTATTTAPTPVAPSNAVAHPPPVRSAPPTNVQPAVAWVQFDLAPAFNRNVISRKAAGAVDGLLGDGRGVLMTLAARHEASLPGPGVPDSGIIVMPGAVPPGRFQVFVGHGNDCIVMTPSGGKFPNSVSYNLPPQARARFSKLAFLTAAAFGHADLNVVLHYVDATDQRVALQLRDSDRSEPLPAEVRSAFLVQPKDSAKSYALYAQALSIDPTHVLRGFTLSLGAVQPTTTESAFIGAVFAVNALHAPAGTAIATSPASTNEVAVAVPVATNVAVAVPPVPAPPEVVTNEVAAAVSTNTVRDLAGGVLRMLGQFQFEAANSEAQRLAAASPALDKPLWDLVVEDVRRLLAFKKKTVDAISLHPGRVQSVVLRTGMRVDAPVYDADPDELTIRKPVGVGFAETKYRWSDLSTPSVLQLFAFAADARNNADYYDYALVVLYQALAQQMRPEDARRALVAAGERDAELRAKVEARLKWIDDPSAPAAASVTPVTATPAAAGRPERGILLSLGPVRWNWRCLDLSAACNADIVFTESRAATEEFQPGGLGWTTAGWLARNNIAGDFNGIPDDGRVLMADNDPRLAFAMSLPPRKSSILLSAAGGRQGKPVRLDFPPEAQLKCRQLALLHASTGGDVPVTLELLYADGSSQVRRILVLDWDANTRAHEPTPDQFVAISTRSNKIAVMNRLEMMAELVSCDEDKALAGIVLSVDPSASPRATAGFFGLSIKPQF